MFTGRFTICHTMHTHILPRVTVTASTTFNKQLTALGAVHQTQQSNKTVAGNSSMSLLLCNCKLLAPQMQNVHATGTNCSRHRCETVRSTDAKPFAPQMQTAHGTDANCTRHRCKLIRSTDANCPMSSTASSHSSFSLCCVFARSTIVSSHQSPVLVKGTLRRAP